MVRTIDPRWRLAILVFVGGSIIPSIGLLAADWTVPRHASSVEGRPPEPTVELAAPGAAPEEAPQHQPTHRRGRVEPPHPVETAPMRTPAAVPLPAYTPPSHATMPAVPEVPLAVAPRMDPPPEVERAPIPPAVQPLEDVRSVVGPVREEPVSPEAGTEPEPVEAPPAGDDASTDDGA